MNGGLTDTEVASGVGLGVADVNEMTKRVRIDFSFGQGPVT